MFHHVRSKPFRAIQYMLIKPFRSCTLGITVLETYFANAHDFRPVLHTQNIHIAAHQRNLAVHLPITSP